ncbi:Uncharacterised protein [uncultured archaeon]|nr:Uncharacterised protein [uncultured archaeon]
MDIGQALDDLTSLSDNETLRDYQHAEKIFRVNNGAFLPKTKNWFHVFFEMDSTAQSAVTTALSTANTSSRISWSEGNLPILGVLVKTVKLPNFNFDIKKNNQYNRWNLTTSKINYDPVEIVFWDDTIDTIRGFWYAYYQYMIQDPRYVSYSGTQTQGIDIPTEWNPSTDSLESLYSTPDNWYDNYGLDTVDADGETLNRTNPFFRSIRIYLFNRAINSQGSRYSEFVLVNPMISRFDHDSGDFSSSDYMQNRMSIEYETVLYNSGYMSDDEIASWDSVLNTYFDTTGYTTGTGNSQAQLGDSVSSNEDNTSTGTDEEAETTSYIIDTTLDSTNGTSDEIDDAIDDSSSSTSGITVPLVVSNYGSGGNPPTV